LLPWIVGSFMRADNLLRFFKKSGLQALWFLKLKEPMGSLPKSKNRPTQDLTLGQQFPKGGTVLQYLSTLNLSQNRVIYKVTLSSPCLWASFHPYPLFQWYLQSKEMLLNFSMKCWNSAFNAQGLRVIIVVVQVRAVKIHVAPVEALRKNERQDETQFTTKISCTPRHPQPLNLMYFVAGFSKISSCVWPNSGF